MGDNIKSNQIIIWYNFAFCSVFFMYFQFLPINIETQPFGVVMCVPIFIYFYRKRLEVRKEDKFLLSFLLTIFIYYIFGILFGSSIGDVTMSFFRLIISPICYFFVLKRVELLHWKSVRFGVYITFSVAIIEAFHIPGLFQVIDAIYSASFRRYQYGFGNRGLCILTTEPSYYVYFAMLLLYSIDFLKGNNKIPNNRIWLYKILVFIAGSLTKSAIVYLFFLIYSGQMYLGCKKKCVIKKKMATVLLLGLAVTLIVCELKIDELSNNRFVSILSSMNYKGSIIDLLFYTDESMGFRFMINAIYLLSIILYPFGMGIGALRYKWADVAKSLGIDFSGNMIFENSFGNSRALDAQAYIPNVVGSIGLFSIFLVLFLYSKNRYNDKKLKRNIVFTVSLFMWIIQSNFFNPVFWMLIGYTKSDKNNRIVEDKVEDKYDCIKQERK